MTATVEPLFSPWPCPLCPNTSTRDDLNNSTPNAVEVAKFYSKIIKKTRTFDRSSFFVDQARFSALMPRVQHTTSYPWSQQPLTFSILISPSSCCMRCFLDSWSEDKWPSSSSFLCLSARSSETRGGAEPPLLQAPLLASASCWRLKVFSSSISVEI